MGKIYQIDGAAAQLREILGNALEKAASGEKLPSAPVPDFNVEIPADKTHGDFAANIAMVCTKIFKMPPRKIAEEILSELALDGTYFERCEIAGAGFMNFFLAKNWFGDVIRAVLDEKENYGKSDMGGGKTVLLEFVSANPTGPMHIGNARGGAIGDSLASVLDFAGYNVSREFYINDAGNQIERFATSLEVRYLQRHKDNIEMPEDGYQGDDIKKHAEDFSEIFGKKYADVSAEERRAALVDFALPKNIAALESDLLKYRIKYDNWFRESTLHESGRADEIVKLFTEKGHTYTEDGAVWFKAAAFGADKDFVLVRANGVPTYVVPDIAYHYDKLVTRDFYRAIDILGADHHGYVARLKAALTALGVDADRLEVIIMQMVRLVRGGETVKVSKRSGKAITLVTLLDDIPADAARFYFNLREANTHFEFDLDLAVEKSSQNPVFYVQYAHARLCSLIENFYSDGNENDNNSDDTIVKANPDDLNNADLELLDKPQEIELIRQIAMFPKMIESAAKTYDPSKLTRYSIAVAAALHKFYDSYRVKNAETEQLGFARLALCAAVKQILRNTLTLLKVECPEKM